MSQIGRIASVIILLLALLETVGQLAEPDLSMFRLLFSFNTKEFQFLFSVGFFMASGFGFMLGAPRVAMLLLLTGILFASRSAMNVHFVAVN